MNSNIEQIVEHLNTIQDAQEITDIIRDPRVTSILRQNSDINNGNNFNQSGGFLSGIIATLGDIIKAVITAVLKFMKNFFKELFWFPWKQSNRALFWKYLWFCIKCGFYLLIFAVAGPIFIVIGIGMVYSKMFAKMGTDGPTLVRQRLSDARDI
jgi:hypothetical protein